jgi:hypothetical protein
MQEVYTGLMFQPLARHFCHFSGASNFYGKLDFRQENLGLESSRFPYPREPVAKPGF